MGCDIHMAVELRAISGHTRKDSHVRSLQRAAATGNREAASALEACSVREGPWKLAACEYYGYDVGDLRPGWHVIEWPLPWNEEYTLSMQSALKDPPMPYWDDRDYEAFARLAGVRNRQDVTSISEPRGVPADSTDCAEAEFLGDHSASWLGASEILDAPQFKGNVHRSGLVKLEDYDAWRELGNPNPKSWCIAATGHIIYEESLEIQRDSAPVGMRTFVRCEWTSPKEWGVVDMARAWADRFGVEAVRFVFGFDS